MEETTSSNAVEQGKHQVAEPCTCTATRSPDRQGQSHDYPGACRRRTPKQGGAMDRAVSSSPCWVA